MQLILRGESTASIVPLEPLRSEEINVLGPRVDTILLEIMGIGHIRGLELFAFPERN